MAPEEGVEGAQQIPSPLLVVVHQGADAVPIELVHLGVLGHRIEEAVEAEVGEGHHSRGAVELQPHAECLFGLAVGGADAAEPVLGAADADRDRDTPYRRAAIGGELRGRPPKVKEAGAGDHGHRALMSGGEHRQLAPLGPALDRADPALGPTLGGGSRMAGGRPHHHDDGLVTQRGAGPARPLQHRRLGAVGAGEERGGELALQVVTGGEDGPLPVQLDGAGRCRPSAAEPGELAQVPLCSQDGDEAADAVAERDGSHHPGKPRSAHRELADGRVGREDHRGVREAAHRRHLRGPRIGRHGRGNGSSFVAELARLVLPGGGELQQLGETVDDPGRAGAIERQLHQLGLQLLGTVVEDGPLVQDKPGRGLMHVGEVGLFGEQKQGEHQAVGQLDRGGGHVPDDGRGHPALLGEALQDSGEVEALVEQLDRAHRDEGDLPTLDRLEGGRARAQRGGPVDLPLQTRASSEQVGAGGQGTTPEVHHRDHLDLRTGGPPSRSLIRPAPGTAPAPTG